VKEILIRIVSGLVKERDQTYFSEEGVQSVSSMDPTVVFLTIVQWLREVLIRQLSKELGLDDEKRLFYGMMEFKERLTLYLLRRTLEVLRDILLLLPSVIS